MQVLRRDETQASLRQVPCGVIASGNFIEIVLLQVFPIARFNNFLFLAEVIQNIRLMRAGHIHFGVAAFVLGGNVCDVVCQLHQLCAAVVRLNDDAFLRLGDVMFLASDLLKAK